MLIAFYGCDINNIYYKGNSSQCNFISIASGNKSLNFNNVYFYSTEKPLNQGQYWHYVDNLPTKW